MLKIVFTGGGTGGHIFPIIAIVREMRKIKPKASDLAIYYFGPKDDYVVETLGQEGGITLKFIYSGKLRRYFDFRNFVDIFKIPLGFFQTLWHFFWLGPDLVFSKGGYGSFPAVVAAKMLGIPVFLHESDSIPGLASRLESKWATEVFTSFSKTKMLSKDKMINVGNPVREEIMNGSKDEAKKIFKIQSDRPIILILGGSQGAVAINNLVIDILPELLNQFEIIHQTGKKNLKEVTLQTNFILEDTRLGNFYHVFDFLNQEQLKHALAATDLVVSRAGAGSLFEISACAKPAILVPLRGSAQEHQLENAYQFSEAGAAEVVSEENLTPHFFLEKLRFLIERPDILKTMAVNSKAFSRVKTANIIANYLLDYLYQTLET